MLIKVIESYLRKKSKYQRKINSKGNILEKNRPLKLEGTGKTKEEEIQS